MEIIAYFVVAILFATAVYHASLVPGVILRVI